MKHKLKVRHYLRYCDDFIMLHEDKKYRKHLVPFIQLFLEKRLKLTLHPRKVIFTKLSQGISFLGYVILPHHWVLRTRAKKRMTKKINAKVADLKKGELDKLAFDQSVQSYLGMPENNFELHIFFLVTQ